MHDSELQVQMQVSNTIAGTMLQSLVCICVKYWISIHVVSVLYTYMDIQGSVSLHNNKSNLRNLLQAPKSLFFIGPAIVPDW